MRYLMQSPCIVPAMLLTTQLPVTVVVTIVGIEWASHHNWWVLPMLDDSLNPIHFEKRCRDKFIMKFGILICTDLFLFIYLLPYARSTFIILYSFLKEGPRTFIIFGPGSMPAYFFY